MSFANIRGRLSKSEMKLIMAGSSATVLCGQAKVLSCNCGGSSFYCCSDKINACMISNGCPTTGYACVDRP